MSFIESPRFPDDISYGSTGGPGFNTNVITVKSGFETRNQNWVQSRSQYDAAFGIIKEEQLSELITYFQAMAGKANEFRYKDWGDFKSCALPDIPAGTDQSLGFGTSTNRSDGQANFQIVKSYTTGPLTRIRDINKPVNGTVLVERDGVLMTEGFEYNIDYTTGMITFVFGHLPLADRGDGQPEEVTCGYEYDVPCRFDTDELNISFDSYAAGSVNVPIVEVRL